MNDKNGKIFNLTDLLLPVQGKFGVEKKVHNLINELNHPNIDWKFVISSIRSYLFDNMTDIIKYREKVLPIIFYYLKEAILRKKNSSLRSVDTFIDRYIYILKDIFSGNEKFNLLKIDFDIYADELFDILISESRDGFFYINIFNKVKALAKLFSEKEFNQAELMDKINTFIILQYQIYIDKSIIATDKEIKDIRDVLQFSQKNDDIVNLLNSVTLEAYNKNIEEIRKLKKEMPEFIVSDDNRYIDFSHNSKIWEKICLNVRNSIYNGKISDTSSIEKIISYLIKKSNQGDDRELQLFISRTVSSACSVFVENENYKLLKNIIDIIMPVLIKEIENNGNFFSAFSTVYNIGEIVIKSDNISIIDYFETLLVESKFCFPEFSGIASDWSLIINSSHLENIRTWMKLIELNPAKMKKLSASLIVNLKLGGVFLKDTDVFQRDISVLLNSDYKDVFHLIISLAGVFPAFYHDIGATGNIRAFTEKIDTNHKMNDLVHFIRKQVHVESSSRTVDLIQKVMEYWISGNSKILDQMVPDEVYNNLDHFFRLINLDQQKEVQSIYGKAKIDFSEYNNEQFWDLMVSIGRDRFIDYVSETDFSDVADDKKTVIINYLNEYYDSKIPTEMTKMLHHIQSIYEQSSDDNKIWQLLYEISDDDFRKMFDIVRKSDVSQVNVEKFITFLHVYRMLFEKYNFSSIRTIEKLEANAEDDLFAPPDDFFAILKDENKYRALKLLQEVQNKLKKEVLLSDTKFDPLDTVEFKRHIAFGIPSMYGFYKEKKFDTLKVFFQMNLIRVRFFESIIESLNGLSGEIDYEKIKQLLHLFYESFLIDGLANQEMINIFNLLETPNLKISQFRDIVSQLLTIHGEISDRFNATYKYVCKEAIENIEIEKISKKYIIYKHKENVDVVIDRFMRDQIMQSPLLQLLDNLLLRLKEKLIEDIEKQGDILCLNRSEIFSGTSVYEVIRLPDEPGNPYDPFDPYDEKIYTTIHNIEKSPEIPAEGNTYAPVWEIGSKAHGLLFAANMEGVNSPEGIILPSDLYKRLEDDVVKDDISRQQMTYLLKRYVNIFAGNRFANPSDPLLLSVRSGAVFSMPGIMDTITNVGMSPDVIEFYSRKNMWFAYDCYRRFLQDIATSFYNMERRIFEKLMHDAKKSAGAALKQDLTGEEMKNVAEKYRSVIEGMGYYIPDDPYEQLLYSIIAVYRSWESELANDYRKFLNISDEWGTAVIVQKMIFGNVDSRDITGVVHSHYDGDEYISLFGEYKVRAQGHDVVSGVASVFPISEDQRKIYKKSSDCKSLEKTDPEIYKKIFDTVNRVRDRWGNDVEIEFTVEEGVLYVLQIRGMRKHVFEIEELVETPDLLKQMLLGHGLAASGGAKAGRAVFRINRIDKMREKYKDDNIILIRPETSPEDIVGIKKSDAMLTSVGGMTSHAVLQMRRLEKSGVSDFSSMKIFEDDDVAIVENAINSGENYIINEGDLITIDGLTGHVYAGRRETRIKKI